MVFCAQPSCSFVQVLGSQEEIVKSLIYRGDDNQGRGPKDCFIATAVYGNPMAPELISLRKFRDETLKKYRAGRKFVFVYYRISPPIARWLKNQPALSSVIRSILNQIVRRIS